MNLMLLNFYSTLRDFLKGEEGQDLIEYALIAALIALGATAAMSSVGSQISNVFSSISTDLGNALLAPTFEIALSCYVNRTCLLGTKCQREFTQ